MFCELQVQFNIDTGSVTPSAPPPPLLCQQAFMDHYLSGAAQFDGDVGRRRSRWTLQPRSHMTPASSSAGFFFLSPSRGTHCPCWVVHCFRPATSRQGGCLICKVLYLSAGTSLNGGTLCFTAEHCIGASEVISSLSAAPVVIMLRLIGTFVSQCMCVWVTSDTLTKRRTHAETITLSPNANGFPKTLKT